MMSLVRLTVMALALAITSSTVHPESTRNQYGAITRTPLQKNQKVPDLQVGCGDGNIREAGLRKKRLPSRRRRSYVPWSGQVTYSVPYQSISVWKPPIYAIQRPYYVPIYGVQGRPPIYFPPQPLPYNPGVPNDNPKRYKGPAYLPPKEMETTTMSITSRFDDLDDRPIWDLGSNEQTTDPPSNSGVVPTRAPRPPGGGALPPLVHNPTGGGSSAPGASGGTEFVPPPQQYPTTRPPSVGAPAVLPNEPSRCVWAIISCCSTSQQISYDCFEERGCTGAFWDRNPCDSDFAKAAIAVALNYYN